MITEEIPLTVTNKESFNGVSDLAKLGRVCATQTLTALSYITNKLQRRLVQKENVITFFFTKNTADVTLYISKMLLIIQRR